ncbi:MAG TPA: NifU family protein, partial [Saprospiraceae bacterium]|nr:NifU family protein [Saprospiraceae bacterium]
VPVARRAEAGGAGDHPAESREHLGDLPHGTAQGERDPGQHEIELQQHLPGQRPHLLVDGGDVQLVEVTDDMHVKIRWMGMCESCHMSGMTLRAGIQEAIRTYVPEVVGVEAVNGI